MVSAYLGLCHLDRKQSMSILCLYNSSHLWPFDTSNTLYTYQLYMGCSIQSLVQAYLCLLIQYSHVAICNFLCGQLRRSLLCRGQIPAHVYDQYSITNSRLFFQVVFEMFLNIFWFHVMVGFELPPKLKPDIIVEVNWSCCCCFLGEINCTPYPNQVGHPISFMK